MTALAAIRPAEWNLPLFLHVLAAMILVGALVVAFAYLVPAWRTASAPTLTAGFRSLLWAALPAFIATRATAEWINREQGLHEGDPPAWVSLGYVTTDFGLLLLIAALVGSGVAMRRVRRSAAGGESEGAGGGSGGVRLAAVMTSVLLVAYVVTIWAMTTKPA